MIKLYFLRMPYLFFVIVFLGFINKIVAQESPGDSISYNLPEIVVTSSSLTVPSTNLVREVDAQDFTTSNAHNVADALTHSTGLSLQTGTSSDTHVTIRGFRHRDVLVLFDGIPISSEFEGTLDLREVSIENITRIKVIKGAPSVMYGTNAMGGAVDIIPKSGLNSKHKEAAVEFGENNSRLFRATYGDGRGILNYFVSANYEAADGYAVSNKFSSALNENGGLRENSDYTRKNVFVHLNSNIESFGNSSVFFNLSDNNTGLPPQAGTDDPDFARLTESNRITVGASNKFSFIPASLKLYYNRYQSEETAYDDSTYTSIDEANRGTDQTLGAKLYSRFVTSRNNLLLLNLSFENTTYKNSSDPESVLDVDLRTYTFAVEDEFTLRNKLSITAGGLVSRFEQPQLNKNLTALNAQIAVGYQLNGKLSLYSSVARRTRFPKTRELFRERYGNPDLKEQRSNNYDLGLKYNASAKIQGDLTLFLNNLENLIDRRDRRSPYENLENISFKGIEVETSNWLTSRIYGQLGYTFLKADEKLADGSVRQLRRIPKHSINMELRYKLPLNIQLSLSGIYVAGLYDLDDNDVSARLPEYLLLGAKTTVQLREYLSAYLSVGNVTDKNYSQRLGYPREGRTARAGVNLVF